MNGQVYEQFFLQPNDPCQRRYETLRAVFVDQQPMKDVARTFDIHYGTVRNWVSEFRAQRDAQQSPFFSRAAIRRTILKRKTKSNMPTCKPCPWRRDGVGSRDTPVSFCSCRCWPRCGSIGSCKKPITPVRK